MSEEVQIAREEQKKKNAQIYQKPVSERVYATQHATPRGNMKEKIHQKQKFSNGMVKNTLIGMKKDGKMMFGRDK